MSALGHPEAVVDCLERIELGRSQWIDLSYVFSARMASSAPHFGKAVCLPLGLSIGGIGLALRDGALFGLQVSLRCQISNVLRVGAPLTHGSGHADGRVPLHVLVVHAIPDQGLSEGREETAAPGADAARSLRWFRTGSHCRDHRWGQ